MTTNVFSRITELDPAREPEATPDWDTLAPVLLSFLDERTMPMQTQTPQKVQQDQPKRRRGWLVAAAAFAVVIVVGLTAALLSDQGTDGETAAPAAGPVPVIIVAQVDFDDRPVIGTFEVTEGADALQCSSGTFEDGRVNQANHLRVFTCESGSNEGTFTAIFTVDDPPTGPGDDNGSRLRRFRRSPR
jgi:anti-sigma-K factor RskA